MGKLNLTKNVSQLDADEVIFFEKELESLKSRSFDRKFKQLKARDLIPVSRDADAGAETITYQQFDQVGMAKLIASYADDLPRADVKRKNLSIRSNLLVLLTALTFKRSVPLKWPASLFVKEKRLLLEER